VDTLEQRLNRAKTAVKEATDRYDSARRKLKALRGRVTALRNELSQIEPKLADADAEERLRVAESELLSARRAYRPLRDEYQLKARSQPRPSRLPRPKAENRA
jgi:chromosome segregation ATPase